VCSAIGSYLICPDNTRRLLMLGGLASGGYALLFFGYFESYPFFVAALLIFSLVGLLITTGRLNRFWIIPPLALAGAFHIFVVGLLLAAVYIMVRDTSVGRWLGSRSVLLKTVLVIGLTLAAASVLLYFYFTDYFIRFTIVPLVKDRFTVEGYSMFSGKHLLDFANQMLLLLPALPFALLLAKKTNWKEMLNGSDMRFLLALTGPCLLMVFMFNPGLGMPRDWDLFCFAGVPLNLLFFYLLLRQDNRIPSRTIAFFAVVLNLIMLGPRVASQVLPEKGLAVFDSYANLDVGRSINGRYWVLRYFEERGNQAEHDRRSRENGMVLVQERLVQSALSLMDRRRIDEAKAELRRAIELTPCYEYAWSNLGAIYSEQGVYDSALAVFEIADAMMPFRSFVYDHKARIYLALGDWERAEKYWWKALKIDPKWYPAMLFLVDLYDREGNTSRRDSLWEAVKALEKRPDEALGDVVSTAILRKDWPCASRWTERCLSLGLDTAAVMRLKEKYPALESAR
ncbi:MAG: tetratricopeptide repeat protein, partial [candidate division Zixibacteria bacterium]|nr:tetratricopeptide repeat protein [candidate division Zixibacteria bacterium]